MICPKCNAQNRDGSSFCADCGTALPKVAEAPPALQSSVICPKCKASNPADKTFCADCGTPLNQPVNNVSETDATKICPACGASNPERNTFCADCGNSFQANAVAPPAVNQPTPVVPQQTPPTPVPVVITNPEVVEQRVEPKPEPPKKKSRALFWILTLLLVPLLLFGIALTVVHFIPKQRDRAYLVSDKHGDNKSLQFDDQKGTIAMAKIDENEYQKWQITPDLEIEDSYRFVDWGLGDDESLQVVDDNSDNKISMAESADDDGQLWAITNVEGDFYRITNNWLGDSKALSHYKKKYYFLRMRGTANKQGQLWKKVPAANGSFYLVNLRHGNSAALEAIYSGKFVDKLYVNDRGNYGNQQWIIKSVGGGYNSLTTAIHQKDKKNKSLDVNPEKKEYVRMADSGNVSGQKWKLTPVGSGYFRLTNEFLGEGQSLEAVTFSTYELRMLKSSNDPGQLWRFERVPN